MPQKSLSFILCILLSRTLFSFEFAPLTMFSWTIDGTIIEDISLSPNGRVLITSQLITSLPQPGGFVFKQKDAIKVWDTLSKSKLFELSEAEISQAPFSPKGDSFLIQRGRNLELLDAMTGAIKWTLRPPARGVFNVGRSYQNPDGKTIATSIRTLNDVTCLIWNAATDKPALRLPGDCSLDKPYSPDGQKIIIKGTSVEVRNSATGALLFALAKPERKKLLDAWFSPNGQKIVLRYTNTDQTSDSAQVFDANSGELRLDILDTPEGTDLYVSPNGQSTVQKKGSTLTLAHLTRPENSITLEKKAKARLWTLEFIDSKRIETRWATKTDSSVWRVYSATTGNLLFDLTFPKESIVLHDPDSELAVVAVPNTSTKSNIINFFLVPPIEIFEPDNLTMITYIKMIKEFMNSPTEPKDYGHYILYIYEHFQGKDKSISKTWGFEKAIFDSLKTPAQHYLRHLIPGRP